MLCSMQTPRKRGGFVEILELLLPIFAIIVTGLVFAHFRILPDGTGDLLIQFAFWVAIPALLFSIIAEEPMARLLDAAFYASFGGVVVAIFLIVFSVVRHWQRKPLGEAAILAFMAVGSNTAFVALPVLHAVFGHRAVLPTAIATVILIVVILITTLLLERSQATETRKGPTTLTSVRHALLNPLVLSTVLAVAYAASGWPLPTVAKQFLGLLGAAVTPCALFAIGMSIKLEDMRIDAATIVVISTIKLIAFPSAVLSMAFLIDLNPILAISGTVCAAVPVGKTAFVLANKYQQSPERVAATISVSSAASVLTLLIWLYVLARVYPGVLPS